MAAESREPVYGWVSIWDRKLGISADGFDSVHIAQTDKTRFTLKTKYPVNFGMVPQKV